MKNSNSIILQPGDILVRKKSLFGIVAHYGLYVGEGKVIDNHPDRGVSVQSYSQFLNGKNLERVKRFKGSGEARSRIVENAISMLGAKYDLISFNCEHFVNRVSGFGNRSYQIGTGLALLTLTLLLLNLKKIGNG